MKIEIPTALRLTQIVNAYSMRQSLGLPTDRFVFMTDYYKRPGNIALDCKHGAMMFPMVEDGVYEVHFLFYPGASGAEKLVAARAMLEEMFTNRGASVIRGFPPRDNRAVRVIGNALGFQKIPGVVVTDDLGRECDHYELEASRWATLSAE